MANNKEPRHDIALVDYEGNIHFDPPVYKQRYAAIQEVLLDAKWSTLMKKIVDFGCAELHLFQYLKRLYDIQEIVGVDIDRQLLKENYFRVQPLLADYLDQRPQPLTVKAFLGSIGTPHSILLNTNAVIGIEIIEHLYPDVLDALPFNIFGFIKPKVAVFTTPNADFNQLFNHFNKFRHYDHKFEWTREQFESWALNICERYPDYSVKFSGIGPGPLGTETLGCCSQMALFERVNENFNLCCTAKDLNCSCPFPCFQSFGICTYMSLSQNVDYEQICSTEYPFHVDTRSSEQIITDELIYQIRNLCRSPRFYNDFTYRVEIPLKILLSNQHTRFVTLSLAETLLQKAGYKVEECTVGQFGECCVIYESEMESDYSDNEKCEKCNCSSNTELEQEDNPELNLASQVATQMVNNAMDHSEDSEKSKEFSANFPRKKKKSKKELYVNKAKEIVAVEEKLQEPPAKQGTSSFLQEEQLHLQNQNSVAEINNLEEDLEVASQEVLFDENSEPDLLDDWDAVQIETSSNPTDLIAPNFTCFVPIIQSTESNNNEVAVENNPFPEWLLHMLRINQETEQDNEGIHDEPHFYCQGDGVGIHPSAIEVDVDEDTTSNSNEDRATDEEYSQQTPSSSNVESESGTLNVENINMCLQCSSLEPTNVDNDSESSGEYFDTLSHTEESDEFPLALTGNKVNDDEDNK